jgi:2-polyprenyl-3-methyl-5-hydroxy-6-metoxy-1,4-benzoquinol methylase
MSVFQPAGNHYDKYGTRNPIARHLMNGFLSSFDTLRRRAGVDEALEAGCGEGELSIRMALDGVRVRAFDIAADAILEARRRATAAGVDIAFTTASLDAMAAEPPSDLVVCCEVLEHLDDPAGGLQILERLTSSWLLASVPREPLWRILNVARGKYIVDLGNTPGHVNHWGRESFLAFLETRFDVVEMRSPPPWTMVLCRRR